MRLLEQLRVVARRRRLADRTIDAYSHWVRDFLGFSAGRHGQWTHPSKLGTADVEAYLNDLVMRRRLSASSQNQALNRLATMESVAGAGQPTSQTRQIAHINGRC